ncbi:MAG: hypothetical protein ACRCR6_00670, partial [Plesiomonas sp.]
LMRQISTLQQALSRPNEFMCQNAQILPFNRPSSLKKAPVHAPSDNFDNCDHVDNIDNKSSDEPRP